MLFIEVYAPTTPTLSYEHCSHNLLQVEEQPRNRIVTYICMEHSIDVCVLTAIILALFKFASLPLTTSLLGERASGSSK